MEAVIYAKNKPILLISHIELNIEASQKPPRDKLPKWMKKRNGGLFFEFILGNIF